MIDNDTLIYILSFLSLKDQIKCMIVCKQWYRLSPYYIQHNYISISEEEYHSNIAWIEKYNVKLVLKNITS